MTFGLALTKMLAQGTPGLKNEYTRLVRQDGNHAALSLMDKALCPGSSDWRGLGHIPDSGYMLQEKYAPWDAVKKFSLVPADEKTLPGCCCAQIIRGVMRPADCSLFKKVCSPDNPAGPCMVSGEGACAAAYQYG